MKKILSVFITLSFLLTLTACRKNIVDNQSINSDTVSLIDELHSEPQSAIDIIENEKQIAESVPQSSSENQSIAEQPTVTTKPLVDFIGKTIDNVKSEFGDSFTFIGYSGSTIMTYEEKAITFFLGAYTEKPTGEEIIYTVLSNGDMALVGNLDGKMTYSEIVAAVGSEVALASPERYYNELDGKYEYALSFDYNGYSIGYSWSTDPDTNHSSYASASKIGFEYKIETQTPSSEQSSTVQTESETSPDDVEKLINETEQYMKEIYSLNIRLEFDYDYGETISCNVLDGDTVSFGVEIDKSTRRVRVYNFSGQIINDFILP